MKIQVQFDVALLSQMTHETKTNLNTLFEEITARAFAGAVQDSLKHPAYGTAISYKVIPDDTDITLPGVYEEFPTTPEPEPIIKT